MRKIIEAVQKLYEMPTMVSGHVDFDLSNEEKIRARAHYFLRRNDNRVIKETGEYCLFRSGPEDRGWIILYNKTLDLIDYYVEFETMSRRLTGFTVTQVALWRAVSIPYFPSVTTTVFLDYLVPTFGAVMSDHQQTMDGRKFWLRVMGQASRAGMEVGFVDFRGSRFEAYDPQKNPNITRWAEEIGAWGNGPRYEDRRFLIRVNYHHQVTPQSA